MMSIMICFVDFWFCCLVDFLFDLIWFCVVDLLLFVLLLRGMGKAGY